MTLEQPDRICGEKRIDEKSSVLTLAVAVAVSGLTALAPKRLHAGDVHTLESANAEAGRIVRARKESWNDKQKDSGAARGKPVNRTSVWPWRTADEMFRSAKKDKIAPSTLLGSWNRVAMVKESKNGLYDPAGIDRNYTFMLFEMKENPFDPSKKTLNVTVGTFSDRDLLSGRTTPEIISPEVRITYTELLEDSNWALGYLCRFIDDKRLICRVDYSWNFFSGAGGFQSQWYIGLERVAAQ